MMGPPNRPRWSFWGNSQSPYGSSNSWLGGKTKSKKMKGGYYGTRADGALALSAEHVNGSHTAKAHTYVGGRRRKGTRRR
jgi:hypothetical protein